MDNKTTEAFHKLLRRVPEPLASEIRQRATTDEKGAFLDALLANLSEWQTEIAENICRPEGADLTEIIAAAGSGKTHSLVTSIALALRRGFRAEDIFASTFTKKAATEMGERLGRATFAIDNVRLGTFHRLAGRYMQTRARSRPGTQPPHRWDYRNVVEFGDNSPGDTAWFWGRITGKPWKKKRLPQGKKPWDLKPYEKFEEVPGLPNFYGLWPETDEEADEAGLPVDPPNPKNYTGALELITSKGLTFGDPEAQRRARAYERGIDPDGQKDADGNLPESDFGVLYHFTRAWELYEKAKKTLNLFDFADLLTAYWKDGTDKARLILVDEAQDNSEVQLNIAQMLRKNGDGRLFLIGDCRQAIYAWRGANPAFMIEAPEKLGADVIQLPMNYRSGRLIVELGNEIADGKWWSIGMEAKSFRGEAGFDGEVLIAPAAPSLMKEADAVARDIRKKLDGGMRPEDIFILVRTNAPGANYEVACLKNKVPCLRLGSKFGLFDRKIIKAAMSYAKLSVVDDLEALRAVANTPKRFLSPDKLVTAVQQIGGTIPVALNRILQGKGTVGGQRMFYDRQLEGVRALVKAIEELRSRPWRELDSEGNPKVGETVHDVPRLIAKILTGKDGKEAEEEEEGEAPEAAGSPTDDKDDELVHYFVEIVRGFESFTEVETFTKRLTAEVKGVDSTDNMTAEEMAAFERDRKERVVISTVHKSKGLEAELVYLSCTKGQFPHARSTSLARQAEEERLFYVAVTRAANTLIITYAGFDAQGRATGASSYVLDYVLPLIRREHVKSRLSALCAGLTRDAWTFAESTEEEGRPTVTATSPDGRFKLDLRVSIPLPIVREEHHPDGVTRTIEMETPPEGIPDTVTFSANVRQEGEDHPFWRPLLNWEGDLLSKDILGAVHIAAREILFVYGTALDSLPARAFAPDEELVARIDGKARQVTVVDYSGGPLYRVNIRSGSQVFTHPIPQVDLERSDIVDVDFAEFLTFLGGLPEIVPGITGPFLAGMLVEHKALLLPVFREVMTEGEEQVTPEGVVPPPEPPPEVGAPTIVSPTAATEGSVDQPPEIGSPEAISDEVADLGEVPLSQTLPEGMTLVEIRHGDWRAYMEGSTVAGADGRKKWPSREAALTAVLPVFGPESATSYPTAPEKKPRRETEKAREKRHAEWQVKLDGLLAEMVTRLGGTAKRSPLGYDYEVPTGAGPLALSAMGGTGIVAMFEDVERAKTVLPDWEPLNKHSGKWNHHAADDWAAVESLIPMVEGRIQSFNRKAAGGAVPGEKVPEPAPDTREPWQIPYDEFVRIPLTKRIIWMGGRWLPEHSDVSTGKDYTEKSAKIELVKARALAKKEGQQIEWKIVEGEGDRRTIEGIHTLDGDDKRRVHTEAVLAAAKAGKHIPAAVLVDSHDLLKGEGGLMTPDEAATNSVAGTHPAIEQASRAAEPEVQGEILSLEEAQRAPAGSLFAVASDGGGWEFLVADGKGGVTNPANISDYMKGDEFWPLPQVPLVEYGVQVVHLGKGKILAKATNTQKFMDWLSAHPRSTLPEPPVAEPALASEPSAPEPLPTGPVWRDPPVAQPEAQGEWLLPDGKALWVRVMDSEGKTAIGHGESRASAASLPEAAEALDAMYGVKLPPPQLAERGDEDIVGYWDFPGKLRVGLLRSGKGARIAFAPAGRLSYESVGSVAEGLRELKQRFGIQAPPDLEKEPGKKRK